MRIVGLLGSGRVNGNTEIMLDQALDEARSGGDDVLKISLRDLDIAPCNGCMGCARTGECAINDDMQAVYQHLLAADGIIWATPVYYWSMSALTKIALDRTFALNFPELRLTGKIGGLILVAGTRGCVSAANPFHMYFNYNHMFAAEFAWGYAAGKGDIRQDSLGIDMARAMARQMKALFQAGLKYPSDYAHPLHRLVREAKREK